MTTTEPPYGSRCLVDTNILLRISQSPQVSPLYHQAILRLQSRQAQLYTTFQNIAEYWNASTRPRDKNGFGLSINEVGRNLEWLDREFEILTEDLETYHRWRDLLARFKVSGRQVHDARLVAHMLTHNIPYLVTSNTKDFARYPDIHLLDPEHWT